MGEKYRANSFQNRTVIMKVRTVFFTNFRISILPLKARPDHFVNAVGAVSSARV
jgi:hypothetical protein